MPYNASDVWKMVPPRNRESIRRDTYLLRKKLNLSQTPYFPIVRFIEHVLPLSDPSFSFEIAEDEELRGVHAEYVPHSNTIRVKASVYEAATNDNWWARSTLAHELGHYYYHDEKNVRYAKLDFGQKIPPDYDPERQANIFAAELLAPIHLLKGMTEKQISREFGVSNAIASRQILALERVNKRQERKHQAKKRRPSRNSTANRHSNYLLWDR